MFFVGLPEGNSVAQELEEERRWEMNLEGLEEGLCDEVRGCAKLGGCWGP